MLLSIHIPKEILANLLCSAIEGGKIYGCGYWGFADQDTSVRPEQIDLDEVGFLKDLGEIWYIHWPLFEGGSLGFIEHNDDMREAKPKHHSLNLETMKLGLQVMAQKYPHLFAQIVNDEIDAVLGEEFLQCCFFGELKYG